MNALPVTIDTSAGSCCAPGQAMDDGTAHDLAKVYSTPEETQHAKEASASA